MDRTSNFYINGEWVKPLHSTRTFEIVNPATEEPQGKIALCDAEDVNRAVAAAVAAFPTWSIAPLSERTAILQRVKDLYIHNLGRFAELISTEMGAPIGLTGAMQAPVVVLTIDEMLRVLESYKFEEERDGLILRREPVGVCGLITPWNWPMHQLSLKVIAALAAGCTMVLKPSEFSALSALAFADILHDAGVPPGVFNLINGEGPVVGRAISQHPDIAMVSFTGSTRAGIQVAQDASVTVKRVTQELGGKSANIILADADLDAAVAQGVQACFSNSGQSCNAPTRMLVPSSVHSRVVEIARAAADAVSVGNPMDPQTNMGPLVNAAQFTRVQRLIGQAIDEGAQLVAGGLGRPEGCELGYFVKPTVFAGVTPDMQIAQEEVFGPVLAIMPYDGEEQAITLANDTPFGLSAYVQSGNRDAALAVARRLQVGNVHVNGASINPAMPFGGYKQSGNGREWSVFGLEEYLEIKAILG